MQMILKNNTNCLDCACYDSWTGADIYQAAIIQIDTDMYIYCRSLFQYFNINTREGNSQITDVALSVRDKLVYISLQIMHF